MSVFRSLSEHSIVEKLLYAQLLRSPNKLLREISLSIEQNAMPNFARLNEISMIWEQQVHQNIDESLLSSKYRTISANFVEIRSDYFCTIL